MTARHAIVHNNNNGIVNLTWNELETTYKDSLDVLRQVAAVLALTQADLNAL